MRIGITGASGLLGSALRRALGGEHEVVRLVRSREAAEAPDAAFWSPTGEQVDAAALSGLDAVVHLAAENIFGRWTEERKRRIRESRVEGTRLLSRALARLEGRPRILLSASGINYYGSDRGDELLDEDGPPGEGFLAEVCVEWEAATKPAADAGIRVALLRSAPVLTPEGGALAQMLTPFKLGVGGRVGSGRQYMSWIGLDDWVAAARLLLVTEEAAGPFNMASPNPVTNAELTRTLAKVLSRPAVLAVPAFALRAVYGEAANQVVLSSLRVDPRRLRELGFQWRHPTLEEALRHALS